MEITITKQVKEVVELKTPAYFKKDGYVPCFYKITNDGKCACITIFPDGGFNLTFESSIQDVIMCESSTSEEFYQVAEDVVRYINNL